MNRSGDRLALNDFMGQDSIDDLIDCVCAPLDCGEAGHDEGRCGNASCLAATTSPAEQPKPAVLEALADLEDAINCEGFGCACAPDFKCATCRTRDTLDKAVRKPFEQLRAALSGEQP